MKITPCYSILEMTLQTALYALKYICLLHVPLCVQVHAVSTQSASDN